MRIRDAIHADNLLKKAVEQLQKNSLWAMPNFTSLCFDGEGEPVWHWRSLSHTS